MAAVDEVTGSISAAELSTVGTVGRKSYRSFTSGDVLFAKITPCMENGKSAIVPTIPSGYGFGSTEFHVLRPRPETEARLIWHLVRQKSFRDEAANHFTGSVGQLRVPPDFLRSFETWIPEEADAQARLATRLDLATTRAASAVAHASACRRAVDRFRQALLAAACGGRLTADWRERHQPNETGADLLVRVELARKERLGRRFKSPSAPVARQDLPETWAWTTVGALVDVATGATPLRKRSDYYGGSIPWVTSGAVNAGLIVRPSDHITELALKETNAKVFPPGTLLVAMYGEGQTRGRVAELGISAATNQALAALVFTEESERLRDFLRICFLENYERIRRLSFGGVQPNLSLGVIRDTPVPIPPVDEQVEIVERVDRLNELAASLMSRIDSATRSVDRATQSVLAEAFRSELTVVE